MSDEVDELAERRKRLAATQRWEVVPDTVDGWRERAMTAAEQYWNALQFIAFVQDRHVWVPPGKKRPVCKLCGTAIDPEAPDEPLLHDPEKSCGLAQKWMADNGAAAASTPAGPREKGPT